MKKIFTLLFALGLFAAAQAQSRDRGDRDRQPDPPVTRQPDSREMNDGYYDERDSRNDNNNYGRNSRVSLERKRDMEIARINRTFEYKMQQVRNSFFMSRFEKQRQIRFLQEQRQREIRMVNAKFSKNKGRYNGRDIPSNHHY